VLRYGVPSVGGETFLFGLKLGQPVGPGAMPTALPVTRTISAMALAASANSRRMGSDEVRRWTVELIGLLYMGAWRRRPSPASSCARVARSALAFSSLAVHGAGVIAAVAKHMVGAGIAVRIGSAVRPQSAFVCLESPNRGRRQAVKAEAAKRGRDSASLYGLRPVRFTAVSSKRAQSSSLRI
jgi:hypothetical protein